MKRIIFTRPNSDLCSALFGTHLPFTTTVQPLSVPLVTAAIGPSQGCVRSVSGQWSMGCGCGGSSSSHIVTPGTGGTERKQGSSWDQHGGNNGALPLVLSPIKG